MENGEIEKMSKKVYAKEFLCSFAMLDTCKRLPTGFDSSILSGLIHAWTATNQGNSLRATTCESGIRGGKKTQTSYQISGLGILGNGAPPKLSIFGAPPILSDCGIKGSALFVQNNGACVIKQSCKPYRPPHFYKENLQSEKLCEYSYDHQLFHSHETPSQDKPRDEQDQKAAIESTKEQLVVLEKQIISPDGHKETMDPEVSKDSENRKSIVNDNNKSSESVTFSAPNVNNADQHIVVVKDLATGLQPNSSESNEQEMNPEVSHGNKNGDPELHIAPNNAGTEQSYVVEPCTRIKLPHELMGYTSSCPKRTKGLYVDIKAIIGLNLDSDDDDDDETELGPSSEKFNFFDETELSLSSENSDSIDELNLPEEDSLITVDDYILVQHSIPMPVEAHSPTDSDKKPSQPDLGVPVNHSQIRSVRPFSQPTQFQAAHKIKTPDVNLNSCTPPNPGPYSLPRPTMPGSFRPMNVRPPPMPVAYLVDPMLQNRQIPIKGQPHHTSPIALNQYSVTQVNQNFYHGYQQMNFPGYQYPNSNHSNHHQAVYRPYFRNGAGVEQRNPPVAVSNRSGK